MLINLADKQLTKEQGVGFNNMSGLDFKLTAAAYLYNVTGSNNYEDDLNAGSKVKSANSSVNLGDVYAIAGYLLTPQTVNYVTLRNNMKSSIISQALSKEVSYSNYATIKKSK